MRQADIRDCVSQRIHLIGIGGSSMSGLARMLQQQGYVVSGSDRSPSHYLEALQQAGIDAYCGHQPQRVQGAGLVVYSAAVPPQDPERQEAQRLGIAQMERAVLLGQLMRGYRHCACISGTHGKTTVSAMLAQILVEGGFDPSVHIGGSLDAIGGGFRLGKQDVFVAEACEFNRSFLHMAPTLAIVTNIEEDHLDCYGDMAHIQEAFLQFLSLLPPDGCAIGLGDDPRVGQVFARLPRRTVTFGLEPGCDWTAAGLHYTAQGCARFAALHKGQEVCFVQLQVAGEFNALHALAALAAAHELGADLQKATQTLGRYAGAHRRFEHTGTVAGMRLYHDYGHNPAEMRSAVAVAKMQQASRVIAVMQPHTFSRVRTLFNDFLTCTRAADITLVTDICAAREVDPGDLNSAMLVDGMRRQGINACHTPSFDDTERWLLQHGRAGDLVLTMGCGDINLLNEQMQQHWDAAHSAK